MTRLQKSDLVAGLCAGLLAGGAPAAASAQSDAARAPIEDAEGQPAGTARFVQHPAGLLIEVELTGMPPGEHGIHLHETGACSPDFAAAGDHFAPDGHEHGFATSATPHAADLPNIVVHDDGRAAANYLNARVSLAAGEAPLLDDDGAAIVVHAEPDDYIDASSAGDRIACGVIEASE